MRCVQPGPGRTAIVTGGASGIGRALVVALARTGTSVVIADIQMAAAEQLAAQLVAAGGSARATGLDVRSRQRFHDLVASTGRLDYLFNVAGIGVLGHAHHYSAADWTDVIDTNLGGTINGVAAAYPVMVSQRSGHIVNMASLAGLVPVPFIAGYAASKFGIVGLSRALRIEARQHGVGVTVVCPAIVNTPLLDGGRYSRINDDVPFLRARAHHLQTVAMEPDAVARRVLRAVARNRGVVVEPWWARFLWYAARCSPSSVERLTGALVSSLRR